MTKKLTDCRHGFSNIFAVTRCYHDDVIKWKHFSRYWPFVREIHRSPVNSPHKGQWRGALMFSLIYVWTNRCVNNLDAGDSIRHHAHYDVTVILYMIRVTLWFSWSDHGRRWQPDSLMPGVVGVVTKSKLCMIHQKCYHRLHAKSVIKVSHHKSIAYYSSEWCHSSGNDTIEH